MFTAMDSSSKNNDEFVRKLTELLELQKEQEEQVRLAEQFSLKLKEQLEKADIKGDFQFKSVDELVTTDLNSSYYSNATSNATSSEDVEEADEVVKEPDKNTSSQNKGRLFSVAFFLNAKHCSVHKYIFR